VLPFRFILLFAIACAVGIFWSSAACDETREINRINDYFSSFSPVSIPHFFQNAFCTSIFDIVLLSISYIAALTFFCPAVLHTVCVFSGITYGFCIGKIASWNLVKIKFSLPYVLFVSAFALLYTKTAAELADINHSCLHITRSKEKAGLVYVTEEIKRFLSVIFKSTLIYYIIRLLYCLSLTVINIK
jgi:hypothetical protein